MSIHHSDIPERELACWLALARAPNIGSRRFAQLLKRFGSPGNLFEAGFDEWRAAGLNENTISWLQKPLWPLVEQDLKWLEVSGNRFCLLMGEPSYPGLLMQIADPPPLLFVEGNPDRLNDKLLAMVGSRNPSPSGGRMAHEFARSLVESGYGIVSGLALGVDAESHRGALSAGGITIAVTGSGPDCIYPRQHQTLALEIINQGGAMITEFPPGTEPRAHNFPRRNRIISGLSLGTLVIEAAAKSGSLITARLAAEQNREVFAVPGSIFSPQSRGCNELIQQGAKLVTKVDDILEELPPEAFVSGNNKTFSEPPSEAELNSRLLKYVAYDPTSVDTLVEKSGMTADEISAELLMLELQGDVAAVAGGCYIRVK